MRSCVLIWLKISESTGMDVFQLSLEFQLFDDPQGHSQDSSKFGEKNVVYCGYIHYNRGLVMPCVPATIMSAILSQFILS